VDFVSAESARAGEAAARYVLEQSAAEEAVIPVQNGDGVTYTVISLGSLEKDGTFGNHSILNRYIRSIYLPKTIQCIWTKGSALDSLYLKTIEIHPENPYYRVVNGRLEAIE